MSHPFFRPKEVHAEALLMIGYRLYPCARIELHPRLTLLAGGNGAGKTTILDALQTILIADQRYLHLNVAAGQNDRDLAGQLQDRIAWAVLHLSGHEKVTAVGACLARRAAADYVDLKPFALLGSPPDQDFFLDRSLSRVTQDLKALGQNISRNGQGGRVKEFASINDYHRFLYDEGLLPLDLSRGGKRQFSLLWRQATQPHLGELNHFLQNTLCHEPEKRLTFDDVERLMQERLNTERQLRRLAELKELNAELCEKARLLDHHRRLTLGLALGQLRQREEAIERDILQAGELFKELDEQILALKGELEQMRKRLTEVDGERDRYLREQGEWSRKHKHYQEYAAHRSLADNYGEELTWAREDSYPVEEKIQEIRGRMESAQDEIRALSRDLVRLKEQERELERRVGKWQDFRKDLARAAQAVGRKIDSLDDLEAVWSEVDAEKRTVQELKPLRLLLAQWQTRAGAHAAALDLAGRMTDLWPDFFDRGDIDHSLIDTAQQELRIRERDITLERDALSRESKAHKALVHDLSRSRIPLPAAAVDLVERGLASPFVSRFDTLDLEAARECQEKVGPLDRAIVPDPSLLSRQRLEKLAQGHEPFWMVLSPDAWKDFEVLARSPHGTIAHCGDIAWYSPEGPVWIGAEARRRQIEKAQERLLEIEAELKALSIEEELIARRSRAIQSFLPKLDAFLDADAATTAAELREKLGEMERGAPRIDMLYPMLQKLFRRSELFSFVEVPAEMEALKAEIASKDARHRKLEESHKLIRNEHASWATELASLQSRTHTLERDLDRVRTICTRLEEEEPPEVLQGLVDFGQAEELAKRIEELDEEKRKAQGSVSLGERKNGELRNRYQVQSERLAKLKQDLVRARKEHERALHNWRALYPEEEPSYIAGSRQNEGEQHRVAWDNLAQALAARLAEVSALYELRLPDEDQPDRAVDQVLLLLLPPGVELEQLEDLYSRLRHELQQIEHKIKSHVEEVRSNVETEIRRLRMHLVRVNRILSTLRFGQIKEIRLELEELPAYQALKKLESALRMISRTESISLREFVLKLREFILKESNMTLNEEQIADYRSYIRIKRVIVDREDRVRDSGLSSGETLGVNLALCLAVLFFIGREQGGGTEGGMLLLALDEAERLDAKALETIRDLLDHVRCQLTVAMPRPVNIPDSLCHLLTPLSQGVTHIHLYHRGERTIDSA